MTTFYVITLFPEAFGSYLQASIVGRAVKNKKIRVRFYNPRDFVSGRGGYRQTDDRPYGGGPGMVMQALPILKAVERALANALRRLPVRKGKSPMKGLACARGPARVPKTKIILFSPAGRQFTNQLAARWAKNVRHLVFLCGHYEGIDARVKKILRAEEISIGPYVLTGGELPALTIIDAVARYLPGVLGKEASLEERRAASADVYTRPAVLFHRGKKFQVPAVLLSGNHRRIEKWRQLRQSR